MREARYTTHRAATLISRKILTGLLFILVIFAVTAHWLPSYSARALTTDWKWTDRDGREWSAKAFYDIVRQHRQWLDSKGKSGKRADLSGADLSGQNLVNLDLSKACLAGIRLRGSVLQLAKLVEANLDHADLHGADLSGSDLTGAYLGGANLSEATLANAILVDVWMMGGSSKWCEGKKPLLRRFAATNLAGASFFRANLTRAMLQKLDFRNTDMSEAILNHADLFQSNFAGVSFWYADLRHSVLAEADLSNAHLQRVNLEGARLDDAILQGTVFEPTTSPDIGGVSSARSVELLSYETDPHALVNLRKQFQDGGFRDQERKVTYAIKRREAELGWQRCAAWPLQRTFNCGAVLFEVILFDWTCQYGMNPGRLIKLVIFLWLVCGLIYFALTHSSGASGIYIVDPEDPRFRRMVQARPGRTISTTILARMKRELRALGFSMLFSLMSTFNYSFRELDFGRWLRNLFRTDLQITASGWARTISGFQSLVSIFLFALWLLTYFGRPFN